MSIHGLCPMTFRSQDACERLAIDFALVDRITQILVFIDEKASYTTILSK
jgi:hypothetical protein